MKKLLSKSPNQIIIPTPPRKQFMATLWNSRAVEVGLDVRLVCAGPLARYIEELMDGKRVIEVGSGTGFIGRILSKEAKANLIQTDINPDLARICIENTGQVCHVSSLGQIPEIIETFPDVETILGVDSFDAIPWEEMADEIGQLLKALPLNTKIVVISLLGASVNWLRGIASEHPDKVIIPAKGGRLSYKLVTKEEFEKSEEIKKILKKYFESLDVYKASSGLSLKILFSLKNAAFRRLANECDDLFPEIPKDDLDDVVFGKIKTELNRGGAKVLSDRKYIKNGRLNKTDSRCENFQGLSSIVFEYGDVKGAHIDRRLKIIGFLDNQQDNDLNTTVHFRSIVAQKTTTEFTIDDSKQKISRKST